MGSANYHMGTVPEAIVKYLIWPQVALELPEALVASVQGEALLLQVVPERRSSLWGRAQAQSSPCHLRRSHRAYR